MFKTLDMSISSKTEFPIDAFDTFWILEFKRLFLLLCSARFWGSTR